MMSVTKNAIKPSSLITSSQGLQKVIDEPSKGDSPPWAEKFQSALGSVASAIQEKIQSLEQSKKNVGDINPDVENTPTYERHVEEVRKQMIQLGESAQLLRAEIRREGATHSGLDGTGLRSRGKEIVDGIRRVLQADDQFVMEAVNSNPGAGE